MREKLIELLAIKVCDAYSPTCDEWQPHNCGKCYANDCRIADLADHLIANDVVQVVRCKDCKHYDNSEGIQWCHLNSKFGKFAMDWHSFPEDGFCFYGERKDA